MSLRVGVDLDGVVSDFRSAFRSAAAEAGVNLFADETHPLSESLSSRDVKRVWDHIRRTPNWWIRLQPYEPDQITRLYELSRTFRWEVLFLTRRPASAGDTVQFQSQWWLEEHGFIYPAVVTVPGSRGELANALRLDAVVDDQVHNCVDVIGASAAKALLLLRDPAEAAIREHATNRGIGVVSSLAEALDVLTRLQETLKERRGRLQRLADWFTGRTTPAPKAAEVPKRDRGRLRSNAEGSE